MASVLKKQLASRQPSAWIFRGLRLPALPGTVWILTALGRYVAGKDRVLVLGLRIGMGYVLTWPFQKCANACADPHPPLRGLPSQGSRVTILQTAALN